jgi:hypothetical protein
VTLNPKPEGDRSRFAGWTGACSGEATCQVTMDSAKTVGAAFLLESSLAVAIVKRGGAGRIVSSPGGIDCPEGSCNSLFDAAGNVVLTATPDRRSRLVAWSVPSCVAQLKCSLSAAADRSVSATFGPGFYRLTAAVQGRGRITSVPTGISCTKTCAASFPYARSVRLAAKPAKGWRFAGWSGDCRGRAACAVKIRRTSVVRATFRRA